VRAAATIASTAASTRSDGTTDSTLIFGQQRDVRHLAAVLLGVALLAAAAHHLAHGEA
jgi:hypothetical protein